MTGTTNNGDSDRDGDRDNDRARKDGAFDGLGALGPVALGLLLGKTPVVLWAVDRELRLTATAGAALVTAGLRPGDGVGYSLYEHFGQQDDSYPPIAAHLAALRGEVSDFEHEWRGRFMAVRVAPLGATGALIEGAIGIGLDVTEQREAERLARQREGELRDARRQESAVRAIRPRLAELEDLMTVLHGVGERLTAGAGGPASLTEVDQLRRSSGRAVDVVRAMADTLNSGIDRETKIEHDRGGGETILLVDDEPQVRKFVRRALEDQGYRVLEAGTVEEALSIGAAFEGRIHLLLTDVVLPGQNGPHLAARLAPVRPEMRILYMTGYADDAIVDRGVLSAGQSLLVKPFTSLGLAHGVKRALRS